MTIRIRESVWNDTAAAIDEEAGVIRNVRVLGATSTNGRVYTPRAMREAAKLYEGVEVNIDHRSGGAPSDRGLLEGFGVLRNVAVRENEVRGDLHYLASHPGAGVILERARRMPDKLGLSHDAEGSVVAGDDKDIVESIRAVYSVDLVRRPATNSGLFESEDKDVKKTVATVLESYKRRKEGKRLLSLLEMDEYAVMAEAPMDVESDMTPEDEIHASIKTMVLAVLDDDSLDTPGKLSKIRAILGVEEKVAAAAPTDGGDEDMDAAAADEGTMESASVQRHPDLAPLLESVQRLERRELVRELLEEYGLAMRDLSATQRRLIDKQSDEEGIRELIESWPRHRGNHHPKPRVGSVRESEAVGSYDDLLKQAKTG